MITEEIRTEKAEATFHSLERNAEIVRDHLLNKMHESLEIGARLIDEEMKGMAVIFRPIIKSFYSNLVQRDLEYGTKKSINGMIKMAKKMVIDGVKENSEEYRHRIDQKFPEYLRNDQTGRQCSSTHRNYPRLKYNLKDTFHAQIQGILPLLRVEEQGITIYDDLCRKAFITEDNCKQILKLQTDFMKKGQKIIKEDLSILNIMTGRELVFRVLERGFDIKIEDFNRDIERIFST